MLSKEDIDAVAHEVVDRINKNPPPFWIDAEEHYNVHRRIKFFIRIWDRAAAIIGHAVLMLLFLGVLWLLTIGFKVGK